MSNPPAPTNRTLSELKASRTHSLSSAISEDKLYNVDLSKVYIAVLKVLLLDYVSEVRFHTPIRDPLPPQPEARKSRMSRIEDALLPPTLVLDLKAKLNSVAMTKTSYDDLTRRLLLRFYGEMLDPAFSGEIQRANSIDILVMKFVLAANKEVVKLGLIAHEKVPLEVFRQAQSFVQIMIQAVQKERNRDVLVAKLNDHMASLRPAGTGLPTRSPNRRSVGSGMVGAISERPLRYSKPSFSVADMDQGQVSLVQQLFSVDSDQMQQDINTWKHVVTHAAINKDVDQVMFYLGKDIGRLSREKFESEQAYNLWKQRETAFCEQLKRKYAVPAHLQHVPVPAMPAGDEFYVMPPSSLLQPFFVALVKLSLLQHRQELDLGFQTPADVPLFSNRLRELLLLCGRVWRIDYPTRAVCVLSAAHMAGLMVDPLFAGPDLAPLDLNTAVSVFETCRRAVEDGGEVSWADRALWCVRDKQEWAKNLGYTYSEAFHSIKECLSSVLHKTRPKFGPYLEFLAEYVEGDPLFSMVDNTLAAKWERKLTRTLMRTAESSYAELLSKLPRDDTLSIVHILGTSDALVQNIQLLQKRYKTPLLGFLNVGRTYAAVVTGMFAADARNILKHIAAHAEARHEFLNYADTIEAYKSLSEIRNIHQQVSPGSTFAFDLEKFFYPYLEAWVGESTEKIKSYVIKAVEEDNFEPMDIDDDAKKYSSSVHDIFSLIRHYLAILQDLGPQDSFELAKIYTMLIKSISESSLFYASEMCNIVADDLNESDQKPGVKVPAQSGWLAEVKSMVSNIHTTDKQPAEAFNFTRRTCIGLNNLNAVSTHLSSMENRLNPERVSSTVARYDPASLHSYTSHVFSIRVVKAENLRSSSDTASLRPYLTLIDTLARKTVAKTQTLDSDNPEWDEEFELTLAANATMTLSATVWEEKFGTHAVCGRALVQLQPRKFKHDGIPQEIYLDLDTQGRILVEIAVESERDDAMFAMGRAHRSLKRTQQRITKLIVGKFSQYIRLCVSRQTLKAVCGSSGNIKPTREQIDAAMTPLYNYLNMNLLVLAQYLTKDLLLQVMLEAWNVVVASADELLLPKLASVRITRNLAIRGKNGWQSAVTSAVANVTSSMNYLGFGKTLTNNEIETVIAWLNFLCVDFFHNQGNGPPLHDLKNEKYQSLLLIPVYYDRDPPFLMHEVEMLAPAFLQTLRNKNNVYIHPDADTASLRSRAGSIARSLTIRANATAKARAAAAREAKELLSDPLVAQTSAENIILRLLLVKNEKQFVAKRMEQRELLAHTIATERLAKAAAEGTLFR